jgi:hypothetical protein
VILPLASRTFRRLTGDAWVFDPVGAWVRVVAMAAALAIGVVTGRVVPATLVASGAFFVGFGAPMDLFESAPLRLMVVSVLSAIWAIVGSVAAPHSIIVVLVAAALGALCGVAASRDAGRAWIAVQCALAGVIATSYPASLAGAATRAEFLLVGGFAQAIVLSLAHVAWRRAPSSGEPSEPPAPGYAVHLAIGLGLAMTLERAFQMRYGYWVPMTTLLVLRPGTRQTMLRAFSRTLGTLGGLALASAIIGSLHPTRPVIAALVVTAAAGTYLFQKASYGLFSCCVTVYAVAVLAFLGQTGHDVAVARIIATLVGAAIGLGVQLVDSIVVIVERGD